MKKDKRDPRQGTARSLRKWLSIPANREKMYRHDKEAAAALADEDARSGKGDYNINTPKPQPNGKY